MTACRTCNIFSPEKLVENLNLVLWKITNNSGNIFHFYPFFHVNASIATYSIEFLYLITCQYLKVCGVRQKTKLLKPAFHRGMTSGSRKPFSDAIMQSKMASPAVIILDYKTTYGLHQKLSICHQRRKKLFYSTHCQSGSASSLLF